jgi:hypothetical protein
VFLYCLIKQWIDGYLFIYDVKTKYNMGNETLIYNYSGNIWSFELLDIIQFTTNYLFLVCHGDFPRETKQ